MTPEEFVAHLQTEVLGEEKYTVDDLLGETGIDLTDAEELWLGLGFPVTGDDGLRFTDADLAVLRTILDLRGEGIAGPEVIVPMTRVLGQALSRVATAQVEIFREAIVEAIEGDVVEGDVVEGDVVEGGVDTEGPDALVEVTDRLVGDFGHFISYVWRRQLVAALRRELLGEGSEIDIVGFVDLVDYTRETRDLADDELSEVLGRFHRMVYDQVTSVHGRVVKVIGDGALFTTRDPVDGALAAVGLVESAGLDDRLSGVRVGLAAGHVLPLDGDVYGPTVNRASRLADHAYPDSVLVDEAMGRALAEHPQLWARRTKPQRLKGLGTEQTYVVRRRRPDRTGD